jgi:hypothetical protein
MPEPPAGEAELAQIQNRLDDLHERWHKLGPKDVLELDW